MNTQKYCLRYPLPDPKPFEPGERLSIRESHGAIHSIYQSYFKAHEAQDQIYYNTKVALSITTYN
jgi:hypothetical protein